MSDLSLDAVRRGDVTIEDLRITPETLAAQAIVAERHANPQLAANLRRAGELTALSDADVMRIYEALRPHRSTPDELGQLARWLDERGAVQCADLVREARTVYVRRGLCR